MKKKIIKSLGIICILILIVLLSGCGMGKVSKSTLEEDIINNVSIQNMFTSKYILESAYNLKNCNITKEQINKKDKEDLIYCDIEIENDYFNVTASIELIYNYYDKGGWLLDNLIINEYTGKPIAIAETKLILNDILENTKFNSGFSMGAITQNACYDLDADLITIVGSELDESSDSIKLNLKTEDKWKEVYGYYIVDFDEQTGWNLHNYGDDYLRNSSINSEENFYNLNVVSVEGNYESTVGTFFLNTFDIVNTYLGTEKLIIKSITNTSISYSLGDFSYETDFNPITGKFSLIYKVTDSTRYTYGDCCFYEKMDCWQLSDSGGDIKRIITKLPIDDIHLLAYTVQ